MLTGVDITSYGGDLPGKPELGQMVRRLLAQVPELPRLRLSSIDAIEIDDALFEAVTGEARIAPYLHLSLQAGDNMILKRMKRRHLRGEAIDLCKALKKARPEMMFGADFIAGFPTETEEMFEETLQLVDEADLTFLHVFPYSVREGTPAAKMPQVSGDVIRARAARLRAKGEAALARHLGSQVGTRQRVLVERPDFGHTDQYTRIRLNGGALSGAVSEVLITGHDGHALIGEAQPHTETRRPL